jgi:putative lipoprotein
MLRKTVLLALALITSGVCLAAQAATVTGTVTYQQRIALAANAVISVSLQDLSQDPPATLVHAEILALGRQVPIPFTLTYRRAEIDPAHRYAVSATIKADKQLLFATAQPSPVISRGAPTRLALVLQAAGQAPATTLEETYWKAAEIAGKAVIANSGEYQPHMILRADGHKVEAAGGCNYLLGSYTLRATALKIVKAVSTKTVCAEAVMKQEQALTQALQTTTGYRLADQKLELRKGRKVLARFTTQH